MITPEFRAPEPTNNRSKWNVRRLWPLALLVTGLVGEVVAYNAVPEEHRARVRIADDYAFRGISVSSESGLHCQIGYERYARRRRGGWIMSKWEPTALCRR
jgi:hypothetical protein